MTVTSTWGHDVMRGLDRPESVAARSARRYSRIDAEKQRQEDLMLALDAIRSLVQTNEDVVSTLHSLSSGLVNSGFLPNSDLAETVEWLDVLADQIQYK